MATPRTFGGLSAGPMSAADRERVEAETRRRSTEWPPNVPDSTEEQMQEATALAIDLYETAASYGVDKWTAESVTSFISAAIDGIRARDRQR